MKKKTEKYSLHDKMSNYWYWILRTQYKNDVVFVGPSGKVDYFSKNMNMTVINNHYYNIICFEI